MARFNRRAVAMAVVACAVVVMGDDAKKIDPAVQLKVNQAASLESMTKWAAVLSNAFMAGGPDKAVNSIAQFRSLMADEMAAQAEKWSSFAKGHPDGIDFGADLLKVLKDGGPLAHPIPEVSVSDPVFFSDGTANVSSTWSGASLSSSFISYSPCVFPITPTGFGVFPQGINVEPQIIGADPQAFNVQPQGLSVAPTLILVAPIAANIQPQGFTVAPTFISISPIRTVVSKVGPLNVAPTVISVTIPRNL